MKEIIEHTEICAPKVGAFITQAFYSGWGKGPDERSNILWPSESINGISSPLDNTCLVAVFHITKINNHARSN